MKCEQDGCSELAALRFDWPGAGWKRACAAHARRALAVSRAMGFALTVERFPTFHLMTAEQALQILEQPDRWPLRVLLPLAHVTRLDDDYGTPLCALLALGHGSTLFLANVGDFETSEFQSQRAFDEALKRFKSVSYVSLAAILLDGWRVD